jgi:hypothetical protein
LVEIVGHLDCFLTAQGLSKFCFCIQCNFFFFFFKSRFQQQCPDSSTALVVYSTSPFVFLPDLLALLVFTKVLRSVFSKADLCFCCRSKSYMCHYTFPDTNELCSQQTFSLRLAHDGCDFNALEYGSSESNALLCEPIATICSFLFVYVVMTFELMMNNFQCEYLSFMAG